MTDLSQVFQTEANSEYPILDRGSLETILHFSTIDLICTMTLVCKALKEFISSADFLFSRRWNFFLDTCAVSVPSDYRLRLVYARFFAKTLRRVVEAPFEGPNRVLTKIIFGRLRCRYRGLDTLLTQYCDGETVTKFMTQFFSTLAHIISPSIETCNEQSFASIEICCIEFNKFFNIDTHYNRQESLPRTDIIDRLLEQYITILDLFGVNFHVSRNWTNNLRDLPDERFAPVVTHKRRRLSNDTPDEQGPPQQIYGLTAVGNGLNFDLGRHLDLANLSNVLDGKYHQNKYRIFEAYFHPEYVFIFSFGRCVIMNAQTTERGSEIRRYIHEKLNIPLPDD